MKSNTHKVFCEILTRIKSAVCILFVCCLLCCCTKTIKVYTDTINNLDYTKPKICEFRKLNVKKFKTEIIDNKLTFDAENLDIFIRNINDYKLAVKEYKLCHQTNEHYLEKIIDILLLKN